MSAQGELTQRCRDCQARLKDDNRRAEKFGAEHPGCVCDAVSISEHSPGRVEDDEQLARVVIEPKHINADGTIETASLRDACQNGLSLQRRSYVDDTGLTAFGENVAKLAREREEAAAREKGRQPETRKFGGVVFFEAGRVRRHRPAELIRFCVMDSAEEATPFHADITANARCKGSEQLRILNELRSALADPVPRMPR
jgi:hypothetical protein